MLADFAGSKATALAGRQVCWQVGLVEPVSPLLKFLHRFVPSIRDQERKLTGVFVVDYRGRMAQEIGVIEYPQDANLPLENLPLEHITWSPDGRRIGFVYHRVLYTVPVDKEIGITDYLGTGFIR